MKLSVYIFLASAVFLSSCYTSRSLSSSMEDDIYYVPGDKPLIVKEVETQTGQNIEMNEPQSSYAPFGKEGTGNTAFVVNREKGTTERVNTAELASRAEAELAAADEVNEILYENTGYWIGGFKGSESDMREAARIISRYPDGFGYIANGQDIAINLSFSPDWNVYTDNGRYWWFPSYTNTDLYSTFIFGTYPKYIWTVVWNQPGYDSFVFDNQFNWGLNFNWGGPGWSLGLGWNNGYYNPWYNGWYGWNGWYNPWWNGYYPGWGYPHWHYPHWGGGHYPNWGPPSHRPIRPVRPNNSLRPGIGTRPGHTTRPGTSVRPGTGTRPGSNVRPGSTVRPGSSVRPGTSVRPGSSTRPGMTRPNSGTSTRPGEVTRPSTTIRPGTSVRPGNTTRPNMTRPSTTNRYTRPATRPNSSSSSNRNGTTRTYNRSQNSTRPSYNNNRSTRSTYSPTRSGSVNRSTPPVRSSSSTRSGGTRSGGRR